MQTTKMAQTYEQHVHGVLINLQNGTKLRLAFLSYSRNWKVKVVSYIEVSICFSKT
jgi:hypothetical protein